MSAPIQTLADDGTLGIVKSDAGTSALTVAAPRAVAVAAGAGSIIDMINYAIEKNVPVESLEKLFGLYERVAARDAAKEFTEALAAFKRECPSVRKARTANVATKGGGEYSYTFADLPEIQRTVDPLLAAHGFSYSWDSEPDAKGLLKVTCTLRHINGHSVPSSMALPTESAAAMSAQQKYGAALTFAQRRTLANALGITIEEVNPETEKAADPTTIDGKQVEYLTTLIEELGGGAHPKFLKHYRIAAIPELRASDYESAVAMLHQVKAKRAEKNS